MRWWVGDDFATLLRLVLADIQRDTDAMLHGHLSVDDWQQRTARLLYTAHYAAYMIGQGSKDLTPKQQADLNKRIAQQIDYLNGFAAALDKGDVSDTMAQARAALYAGALKASYSRGATKGYDLPAYPTEGSECMVNCKCYWAMREIDAEELDADFTWTLTAAEHCPTCQQRAQDWAPYKIRGGEAA